MSICSISDKTNYFVKNSGSFAIGVLVLKEVVAPLAIVGIIAVVLGIFTVYWWGRLRQLLSNPFQLLREAGARYALLTGLVIAGYSVWDKMGVRYVNPFLYMYFLALGSALFLAPYMWRINGANMMRAEEKQKRRSIIASGFLMFLAYGLILVALQFSRVSYVAAAREVGIVMGVLFGIVLLGEPFGGLVAETQSHFMLSTLENMWQPPYHR